jgi:branched-chain amino acid transport system ATP-binding protein
MLEVRHLVKHFGGLYAVDDVSFTVKTGTITGLIGPNGAGKTTLFHTIAGGYRPDRGEVFLGPKRISGLPPHRIFQLGLVRTFQIPKPFREMTVLENLMVAAPGQLGERFWSAWVAGRRVRRQEREIRERAVQVMEFLNLGRVAQELAKNLSGGQQKLVEIGRALMSDPQCILLDEPGAGVNPSLLVEIVDRIAELNSRGITFLLIEHNMDVVMNLCDPVLVMAQGRLLLEGPPDLVRSDSRVLDAYLGGTPA